jgi:hypothetical protein
MRPNGVLLTPRPHDFQPHCRNSEEANFIMSANAQVLKVLFLTGEAEQDASDWSLD